MNFCNHDYKSFARANKIAELSLQICILGCIVTASTQLEEE